MSVQSDTISYGGSTASTTASWSPAWDDDRAPLLRDRPDPEEPLGAPVRDRTQRLIMPPLVPLSNRRKMVDLGVLLLVSFLTTICYSVVLPSLNSYLNHINAAQIFLGFVVSSYSLAACVAAPVMGVWADRRGTKEILAIGLVLNVSGNILYSFAFAWNSPWTLMGARFLVGTFAGSTAVTNAHISLITHIDERTKWMTLNAIACSLGFILGPSLSILLTKLDFGSGMFVVNEFTSPGYLSGVLALIALLSLVFLFKDVPIQWREGLHADADVNVPPTNWTPLLLCVFYNFMNVMVLACFETVTVPFTKALLGWSVFANGLLFTASGGVAVLSFILLTIVIAKWGIDDRPLFIISVAFMMAGYACLIAIPWESLTEWRLCLGAALLSFGYSPASALVIAIFSKVIPQEAQGLKMGYFSAGGSVARVVGPILSNVVYIHIGPSSLWAGMTGALVVVIAIMIFTYPLLQPLPQHITTLDGEVSKAQQSALKAAQSAMADDSMLASISGSVASLDAAQRSWTYGESPKMGFFGHTPHSGHAF